MNADVSVEQLVRAVRTVRHALRDAADGQAVIVLSATAHELVATATGRSMTISCRLPAVALCTGTVSVPGRFLGDLLASSRSERARLAAHGTDLALDLGETSASLRLMAVDPPRPVSLSATAIDASLTADEVQRCAAVAVAASTDPHRPVLMGVHFGPGVIEATDNYRIARANLADWHPNVSVPAEVIRLVASVGSGVRCRFDGRVISVAAHDTTWACATLAHPYPDLSRFFEKPATETLICDRHELLQALDVASAIPGAAVDLRGAGDHLAVSAESAEIGRIETTVGAPARVGLDATFTGSYLRDAVRLATGEQIRIELGAKQAVIRCDTLHQLLMRRVAEIS